MAWLEPDKVTLLRELCAHVAHIAACNHSMDYYKSWAFCASFASIASLASACNHPAGSRKSIAGLKQGGIYVSALTAEYPPSLASALASLMTPFCSSTGKQSIRISDFANLLPEPVVHRRPPVCDGAGMRSAADHSKPCKSSPLNDVVQRWQAYAEEHSITPDLVSHLMQRTDSHPLTPQQQMDIAEIAHRCLHPTCAAHDCLLVSLLASPSALSSFKRSPHARKTQIAARSRTKVSPLAFFSQYQPACNGNSASKTSKTTTSMRYTFCVAKAIGRRHPETQSYCSNL